MQNQAIHCIRRILVSLSRGNVLATYLALNESIMDNDKGNRIAWIDMELTGLDAETNTILEIACVISDENLNIISEEFNIVLNHEDVILESMDEWNTTYHSKTGLIEESKASKINMKDGEEMLLNFLKKYIPRNVCPLAGNTIYMDRLFLLKHMPLVNEYLHYRLIDVSTIKELVRRWYPKLYENAPKKKVQHRAMSDIMESIGELKYYKEHIFIPSLAQ